MKDRTFRRPLENNRYCLFPSCEFPVLIDGEMDYGVGGWVSEELDLGVGNFEEEFGFGLGVEINRVLFAQLGGGVRFKSLTSLQFSLLKVRPYE